jgi:hypothetical protein
MISSWVVRLEVARDDRVPLGDEVIAALTEALSADQVLPVLGLEDSGSIGVRLTVRANNDQSARSAAEGVLRDRAQVVWTVHGLAPFTISFVDAKPGDVSA